MKKTFLLFAVISAFAFLVSCKKNKDSVVTPVPPVTITYDTDAQKFFDSSAVSDTLQKSAINTLVTQLKDSSLWSKFKAIYPMVGGSSSSTKFNLKDPRNLDAAYRLTFNGTPSFSGTGVLFSTPAAFADTHINDSTITFNDNSISYFSRTQNTIDGYDMGCADSKAPYNEFAIYQSSDATNWFGFYKFGDVPANTLGLFTLTSTISDVRRFENGKATITKGSAPTAGFTGMNILVGSVNNAPANGQRECALAAVGQGLSDAQAMTFNNIVHSFETKLGR
ncbi:MAG: hypothetical protein M3139_04945 [Bacteroidota bacterium]|nr:hypothetical protein [Bacteroidota bacterium]